jgi:predicted DNA-binding protein (UPF0251 family)
VRLYSNPKAGLETVPKMLVEAKSSPRHRREPPASRQSQIRLDPHEANALAAAYRDGMTIKELAQRYGVHRTTVTALLRRSDVPQRPRGLAAGDVARAALLYELGWSLARLGARYGVDATTVWRTLRAAGVEMRSPAGG